MMNPDCPNCEKDMLDCETEEVCQVGTALRTDMLGEISAHKLTLYQCPRCKKVVVR